MAHKYSKRTACCSLRKAFLLVLTCFCFGVLFSIAHVWLFLESGKVGRWKTSLESIRSQFVRVTARATRTCHFESLPLIIYRGKAEYDFVWVVDSCTDVVGQLRMSLRSLDSGTDHNQPPYLYSDTLNELKILSDYHIHHISAPVRSGSVVEYSVLANSLTRVELESDQFAFPAIPIWDKSTQSGNSCFGIVGDSYGNAAVLGELVSNLLEPENWADGSEARLCNHGNGLDLLIHMGAISAKDDYQEVQSGLLDPLEQRWLSQTTPLMFTPSGASNRDTGGNRAGASLRGYTSTNSTAFADLLLSSTSAVCTGSLVAGVYIATATDSTAAFECLKQRLSSHEAKDASFRIVVLPIPPDREYADDPTASWLDKERDVQHRFVDVGAEFKVDILIGPGSGMYQRSAIYNDNDAPILVVSGGGGMGLQDVALEHRVHEKSDYVVSHAQYHAIVVDLQRHSLHGASPCTTDTLRWAVRSDDMALLDYFEIKRPLSDCSGLKKTDAKSLPTQNSQIIPSQRAQHPRSEIKSKHSSKKVSVIANQPSTAPVPAAGPTRREAEALLRKRMKRRRQRRSRRK